LQTNFAHTSSLSGINILRLYNLAIWVSGPSTPLFISRVGQIRKYIPYMAVLLVISLPKIPYINRIYMFLANPIHKQLLHIDQVYQELIEWGAAHRSNASIITYVIFPAPNLTFEHSNPWSSYSIAHKQLLNQGARDQTLHQLISSNDLPEFLVKLKVARTSDGKRSLDCINTLIESRDFMFVTASN